MNRRLITTPDLHDAVGAALRCWDVESVEACPWLQMAAMTGASLIAGLLCRHAPPLDFPGSSDVDGTLAKGSEGALLGPIILAMSEEAGIPTPQAAAFFVRLFVDVLAVPAYQTTYLKLPEPIARIIADEWMRLGVAAWHTGWYPGLDGPAQAAAELSAGWPWLLLRAAIEGDIYTRWAVSVASGHDAALPAYLEFAAPTSTTSLPRRIRSAATYTDGRLIANVGAFMHALGGLLDGTELSDLAQNVIQEMAAWLALQDMTKGILPPAVKMKIGLANGDTVVSILGDGLDAVLPAPVEPPALELGEDVGGAVEPEMLLSGITSLPAADSEQDLAIADHVESYSSPLATNGLEPVPIEPAPQTEPVTQEASLARIVVPQALPSPQRAFSAMLPGLDEL